MVSMELGQFEFKTNKSGITELMGSDELVSLCGQLAHDIAERANDMADDPHGPGDPYYYDYDRNKAGFAHGAAYTQTVYGINDNAKYNTLLKALGGE